MEPSPARDLYVVSDLHLGRGRRPETRRWARLEAFLYDQDFLAFCRWLVGDVRGPPPAALVLNGDVFDFLRIEPVVAPGARGAARRFGSLPTPAVAAQMVGDILSGHPQVLDGLAEVLAAGHEVVFLPGNHDLETQSDEVRAVLRAALAGRLEALGAPAAVERLRFQDWFVHEPGRLWIEHGCQYDPENAFAFPLRRRLRPEAQQAVAEGDLPLGNFFQRYLYNAFGSITFLVPSTRANYRYFRWLLANQPRLLARVAWSQGRFLLHLLRRLARLPAAGWRDEAAAAHRAEVDALAERSGLGERLLAIERLAATGAGVVEAAGGMVRQAAKLVLGSVALGILLLGVFSASTAAIDALQFGIGGKALLSLLLYLVFAALAAVGLVAAALRVPDGEPPRALEASAARIAELLDVPLVVFGHTHEETVVPLARPSGRAWYFNTGTWIAVFTHDVLLPRDRVQHTFLRVRGADGELLHWSSGRGQALPVVLLEEERPGAQPR